MLELRGVTYRPGTRTLVDRIDVEFEPGTITVLVAPAAAGDRPSAEPLTPRLRSLVSAARAVPHVVQLTQRFPRR